MYFSLTQTIIMNKHQTIIIILILFIGLKSEGQSYQIQNLKSFENDNFKFNLDESEYLEVGNRIFFTVDRNRQFSSSNNYQSVYVGVANLDYFFEIDNLDIFLILGTTDTREDLLIEFMRAYYDDDVMPVSEGIAIKFDLESNTPVYPVIFDSGRIVKASFENNSRSILDCCDCGPDEIGHRILDPTTGDCVCFCDTDPNIQITASGGVVFGDVSFWLWLADGNDVEPPWTNSNNEGGAAGSNSEEGGGGVINETIWTHTKEICFDWASADSGRACGEIRLRVDHIGDCQFVSEIRFFWNESVLIGQEFAVATFIDSQNYDPSNYGEVVVSAQLQSALQVGGTILGTGGTVNTNSTQPPQTLSFTIPDFAFPEECK